MRRLATLATVALLAGCSMNKEPQYFSAEPNYNLTFLDGSFNDFKRGIYDRHAACMSVDVEGRDITVTKAWQPKMSYDVKDSHEFACGDANALSFTTPGNHTFDEVSWSQQGFLKKHTDLEGLLVIFENLKRENRGVWIPSPR